MLFNIDCKKVEDIPHREKYDLWRRSLSDEHYVAIMEALEMELDGGQVHTASFIPGAEWGEPYIHIWEACGRDHQHSGFFFGLLMWEAVMKHNENWSFIKNTDVKSMVYFRIEI